MLRWLLILIVLGALAAGAVFVVAGQGAPPALAIEKPEKLVGQTGALEVTADAPGAVFSTLNITLEQNDRSYPLFSLDNQGSATVTAEENRLRISRPLGKESLDELRSGPARLVVSATRPSLFNLRQLTSNTAKDIQVKLDPPTIFVMSTHHYVNHGGSELVVYRVSPPDSQSGVRVGGTVEYAGFPVPGSTNPELKMAFFALLHEQDIKAPIVAFARDEVGNEVTTAFVDTVFPKPFRRSRIALDDRFLQRVVPEILQRSPGLAAPANDLPAAFLKINGELRRQNAQQIEDVARKTSPSRQWQGPFAQLGNSQVEASFADHRTYLYQAKEVDNQVHLGFDLAVTAAVPVIAANSGTVLHASWLGIYGNCVIVDHGMAVASLYGHLSSIDVKPGDTVEKGRVLGRSGMTGLAGGDHLHFTMLVGGRPVNPVEWWDSHWIEDRVERKLKALGNPAP
jgi:murein DD-endopeptidase MepM/ murein hydrolase activator NlpD